jgi:hypothetical protein
MKAVDELLAEMIYTFLVSDLDAKEARRTEFVEGLLASDEFEFRLGDAFSSSIWFRMDPDGGPRIELTSVSSMAYNTYWYKAKTATEILQNLYAESGNYYENSTNR